MKVLLDCQFIPSREYSYGGVPVVGGVTVIVPVLPALQSASALLTVVVNGGPVATFTFIGLLMHEAASETIIVCGPGETFVKVKGLPPD